MPADALTAADLNAAAPALASPTVDRPVRDKGKASVTDLPGQGHLACWDATGCGLEATPPHRYANP